MKAIQSMISLPHISFGSDIGKHQLLHHFRFSVDYLRRARLLDSVGKPMNLFAIASHLYYTEPSNFALVALLRRGVLHEICGQSSLIAAKRDFIILMSHLFGRRYISRLYTSKQNLELITKRYPSVVVLPPLQDSARQVLLNHDQEILRVFVGYALAYASKYASSLEPDYELPLSQESFVGTESDSTCLFRRHLNDTSIHVVARSLFAANSGHGDEFKTVKELTQTVRRGLHLNGHAIPSLEHIVKDKNEDDMEFALNAYLFDFYTHGQVSSLVAANGIRRGDIWYALQARLLACASFVFVDTDHIHYCPLGLRSNARNYEDSLAATITESISRS